MGTASCECEHTRQWVISLGVKLPHSVSACADNGGRPGGPCIILLPAPSEVTLEWRDTLGRYQFPKQVLQTSPQILCLVTSPPLQAEGSQPHSSPCKQMTCPESCGMPLSHCLPRVLTAPQNHGLGRDTFSTFYASYHIPEASMVSKMRYIKSQKSRQTHSAPACQYLAVTQYSICPAIFSLSMKPHPPFLTQRSCGDRHIRILFSFERNLDNSRVSMRNLTQWEGWNILFQSALMQGCRTELEPKAVLGVSCGHAPLLQGCFCCRLDWFLPFIHVFNGVET